MNVKINKGDILEWETVNGICRGKVAEIGNRGSVIRVDDKTAFPIRDLERSARLKVNGKEKRDI